MPLNNDLENKVPTNESKESSTSSRNDSDNYDEPFEAYKSDEVDQNKDLKLPNPQANDIENQMENSWVYDPKPPPVKNKRSSFKSTSLPANSKTESLQ